MTGGSTATWRRTTSLPVIGWAADGLPRPEMSGCGGTPLPSPSTPPATSTWARCPGRSARSTTNAPGARTFAAPRLSSHVSVLSKTTCWSPRRRGPGRHRPTSGRSLWVVDLGARGSPSPVRSSPSSSTPTDYCGNHFGQIEERDLDTGQLTGVRLDPQLGSVGDLVATHDLMGFAAGEAAYTHWTVDARTSSLACARRKRGHPSATTRRRPTSWCRTRASAWPTAPLVPVPP